MDAIKTLREHRNDLYSIVFSPDGSSFWSSAMDRTVKEWDLDAMVLRFSIPFPSSVNSLSMAHDGRRIAFCTFGNDEENNRVGIFDVHEHKVLWDTHASPWWVYCVDFAPDSRTFISSDKYGFLRLWDTETGEKIAEWGVQGGTSHVQFSPSGKHIASCGDGEIAEIWDSKTNEKLFELIGHDKWVSKVLFTPDEKQLITCSRDYTVKIWNMQGQCEQTLKASPENARCIALSSDGRVLVSGWDDNYTRIAVLEDGKWERRMQARSHSKPVSALCFSPDCKTLVSGGWDNNIIIWDVSEY